MQELHTGKNAMPGSKRHAEAPDAMGKTGMQTA